MYHKGKKSKNLKQPNKNKNQNTKSSSESNSLRTWRSLGGHSTWLVAFTIAISKSYDEKTNPNHKPNITLNPMMKKHLKCQWIHIQNDWKKKKREGGPWIHCWPWQGQPWLSPWVHHRLFWNFQRYPLFVLWILNNPPGNIAKCMWYWCRRREKERENERKWEKEKRGVVVVLLFWLMFQQGKNSPKCTPTMWDQQVVSFTISSHEMVIYGAKIIFFSFFFFFSEILFISKIYIYIYIYIGNKNYFLSKDQIDEFYF